jgi:hypothetical protein
MRNLGLFATAFLLATGAFWLTMLTSPPTTEAAPHASLDIRALTVKANPPSATGYEAN